MLRYLSLRVLYTLPVIWLVVSRSLPPDPSCSRKRSGILQMLWRRRPCCTDIEATRHAYGLDVPLGQQYMRYWKGVVHGDLGRSLRFNQSVSKLIVQRYPYTLQLTLGATIVAVLLSVPRVPAPRNAAIAGTTACSA